VIPALGGAESVSLQELEGRTVAVTGGRRLRVIDVITGRRLFDAQGGGGGAALVETAEGPHVLSLAAEAENQRDDSGRIDTASVVIRRWLEVSASRPGGKQRSSCSGDWWVPASLQNLMVSCVFVLPGEDDCIVPVCSEAGELAAWSCASGGEARVKAHETPVRAVAGAVTSGDPVVISSDRHRLHVWRLAEDHALEGPLCSTDFRFEVVTCADLAGQLFVATLAAGRWEDGSTSDGVQPGRVSVDSGRSASSRQGSR
jgi:hypothetical protein